MDTASVFAAITKAEKQEDGTLLVRGVATDSTLDIDEQVCDPEWLKTAMPRWFRWGNIREQHSSIAAGVAEEYEEKDGAHHIVARVVDPSSIAKVEAKVLKGFSIGIRRPRIATDKSAPGGRIVDGEIVEVSLVDRPANPACTLTLAKTARPGQVVSSEDLSRITDDGPILVRVEEYAEKGVDVPTDAPLDIEPAPVVEVVAVDGQPVEQPADPAPAGEPAPVGKAADGATDAPDEPTDAPADEPAEPADEPADEPAEDGTGDGPDDAPTDEPAPPADETAADLAVDEDGDVDEGKAAGVDLDAIVKAVTERLAGALGVDLGKKDYTADERDRMAKDGEALPDGSFPIANRADLKDAIQAIGRAKDPEKAKAHIKSRAKALDAEDLIPDSWKAATPDETKTVRPLPAVDGAALVAAVKAIGVLDPAQAHAYLGERAVALGRPELLAGIPATLGKAAGTHDPAALAAIRNGLLACIIAEAQEAMTGEREEWDIDTLLRSLRMFLAWWDCEAAHGEVAPPAEVGAGGATEEETGETGEPMTAVDAIVDALDAITPDDDVSGAVIVERAPEPEVGKAAGEETPLDGDEPATRTVPALSKAVVVEGEHGPEIVNLPAGKTVTVPATETPDPAEGEGSKNAAPDTVKAALAEAIEPLVAEVHALRVDNEALVARLAEVEKAAAPGGPVRIRPTAAQRTSREGDRLRADVYRYTALAKTVGDQQMSAEYTRLATKAAEDLRALTAETA